MSSSPADVEFFEGCLSLPGYTAIVPRAREVRVECLDDKGARQVIEASGWYARILQHEIDHLQGTLYLDRMLSRTLLFSRTLRALMENEDRGRGQRGAGQRIALLNHA